MNSYSIFYYFIFNKLKNNLNILQKKVYTAVFSWYFGKHQNKDFLTILNFILQNLLRASGQHQLFPVIKH